MFLKLNFKCCICCLVWQTSTSLTVYRVSHEQLCGFGPSRLRFEIGRNWISHSWPRMKFYIRRTSFVVWRAAKKCPAKIYQVCTAGSGQWMQKRLREHAANTQHHTIRSFRIFSGLLWSHHNEIVTIRQIPLNSRFQILFTRSWIVNVSSVCVCVVTLFSVSVSHSCLCFGAYFILLYFIIYFPPNAFALLWQWTFCFFNGLFVALGFNCHLLLLLCKYFDGKQIDFEFCLSWAIVAVSDSLSSVQSARVCWEHGTCTNWNYT